MDIILAISSSITCSPHISDSGSCDVSASSVSLSVTVTLGMDSGGHPTLSAAGCSLGIGHLDITFHGGARYMLCGSWILSPREWDNCPGSYEPELSVA